VLTLNEGVERAALLLIAELNSDAGEGRKAAPHVFEEGAPLLLPLWLRAKGKRKLSTIAIT